MVYREQTPRPWHLAGNFERTGLLDHRNSGIPEPERKQQRSGIFITGSLTRRSGDVRFPPTQRWSRLASQHRERSRLDQTPGSQHKEANAMSRLRRVTIVAFSMAALIASLLMIGGTAALAASQNSPQAHDQLPPPSRHYVLLSHVPASTCQTMESHEASTQITPTCDWRGTGKMGIRVGFDCWQPDPVGSLECYVCVDGYCAWVYVPGY